MPTDISSLLPHSKIKCTCDLCNHSRLIKRVIRRVQVKELRKFLRHTYEAYFDASAELEMANAYIKETAGHPNT